MLSFHLYISFHFTLWGACVPLENPLAHNMDLFNQIANHILIKIKNIGQPFHRACVATIEGWPLLRRFIIKTTCMHSCNLALIQSLAFVQGGHYSGIGPMFREATIQGLAPCSGWPLFRGCPHVQGGHYSGVGPMFRVATIQGFHCI